MLTEQEVLMTVNQRIKEKTLSKNTVKYIDKIKVLQDIAKGHQGAADEAEKRALAEKSELQRVKGAISILLELIAEEEGLVSR